MGFIQIALLGVIDFFTGYEISFSVFYLIPVTMTAWFAEKRAALVISVCSAVIWGLANYVAGEKFSNVLIPIWNASTRLGFFLLVTALLIKLKQSFKHERSLARTDFLTGAANPRAFYELAQMEINRSRRFKRSFSIMYFDIDNFKQVNDTLGHHIGSDLLVKVVDIAKQNLRSTDVVARLGGDEFAVLLCETNQDQARTATEKIRAKLLSKMQLEGWAVTFSIGVLTCVNPPKTVAEVIEIVDGVMYQVKNNGKNSVKFEEYGENPPKTSYQKTTNFMELGNR